MIVVLACSAAGFLLAVLWFDLMFDVQVLDHRETPLPEEVVASIAGYYRRVTTEARPMNRLVAISMVVLLGALAAELIGDDVDDWVASLALLLAATPIALAGLRVVPNAVRLGTRADDRATQELIARRICRDHLFCFCCIAVLLVLQLAAAT